jgi:hypothetical protein
MKLNFPTYKGYIQTEDGYEHRGRNEDGPIGIKPKFNSWPGLETKALKTKGKHTSVKEVKGNVTPTKTSNTTSSPPKGK